MNSQKLYVSYKFGISFLANHYYLTYMYDASYGGPLLLLVRVATRSRFVQLDFELTKTTSSLPTRVRFVEHDCGYRLGFCDGVGAWLVSHYCKLE